MSNDIRHRKVEFRASTSEEGVVTGYVTTFDDPYPIGRGLKEVITRTTFDTSRGVPLLWEHNWDAGPIGVSRSLTADDKGLKAEFELFLDDPRARAVWRAMKAGALNEFSIGFLPDMDAITRSKSGDSTTETITKGDLIEVSSVLRGANPSTETVSVRAVPPVAPAAPGAAVPAHPDAALGLEDAPPTKAGLLSDIAEVVEDAIELGLIDQLPKIIAMQIKLLHDSGGAVAPDPNAAPAAPAAPAPPAAHQPPPVPRSNEYVSPALLRALGSSNA